MEEGPASAVYSGFLNLDFEEEIPDRHTPSKWYTGGKGYNVTLDHQLKYHASKSLGWHI